MLPVFIKSSLNFKILFNHKAMNKFKTIGVILFCVLFLVIIIYFENQKPPNTIKQGIDYIEKQEVQESPSGVDMIKLMADIQKEVSTIKSTIIYTEKTDPNNQLGKIGSYMQKCAFWDVRTGHDENPDYDCRYNGVIVTDCGGGLEVFASKEDAKKRFDYLMSFSGTMFGGEHIELIDNKILRISKDLTKSEQDEIISILKNLI